MNKQKALDLINTIPIEYYDNDIVDGESIIYIATIQDSETNRNIIESLGYTKQEIDSFKSYRDSEIDLTNFVWDYANWFDGEKFIA